MYTTSQLTFKFAIAHNSKGRLHEVDNTVGDLKSRFSHIKPSNFKKSSSHNNFNKSFTCVFDIFSGVIQ
jgi:hypothetical protein